MMPVKLRCYATALLAGVFSLLCGIATLQAADDGVPPGPSKRSDMPAPKPASPAPVDFLAWDSASKELVTKAGDEKAEFVFSVTNTSMSSNVVIERVQTSCGCTVAKLPSQPWVLKPHEDGKIDASVDLRGKSGTLFKNLTVFISNSPPKRLDLKVVIPDSPEMARVRNQQMAMGDRQMVFRGDCATCHFEPTKGKMGKELYAAACAICHEAEHRATMVPNLHALNHSTDRNFWKAWITTGKVGTLMPAFATANGGPLSPEQIDSLADYLDQVILHNPLPPPTSHAAPASLQHGIVTNASAPLPPPIPVKAQ